MKERREGRSNRVGRDGQWEGKEREEMEGGRKR